MPNYRSLVGGFFSSNPMDRSSGPVSIRMNNPGAVNGAAWARVYPGYVSEIETTPGNRSTVFETPEQGIAVWWDLLRRYRAKGVATVDGIVTRYGGGQDYSAYLKFVLARTGFSRATVIDLNDDAQLLKLGRAMFRYEAGREIPWSDAQILSGFKCGRAIALTGKMPGDVTAHLGGTNLVERSETDRLLERFAMELIAQLVQRGGATQPPPSPILSPIDKLFGGEALAGKKTALSVVAYVALSILKAVGVLGAATPAGQILSILTIAFGVLGGLAKVDRAVLSLSSIGLKPK